MDKAVHFVWSHYQHGHGHNLIGTSNSSLSACTFKIKNHYVHGHKVPDTISIASEVKLSATPLKILGLDFLSAKIWVEWMLLKFITIFITVKISEFITEES